MATDIAQPVVAVKTSPKTAGQTTQTSTAQPVGRLKTKAIGHAWKNPA